jgi:MoCo/4Fe-4S cofactor protein with predicted Tat translocation signal
MSHHKDTHGLMKDQSGAPNHAGRHEAHPHHHEHGSEAAAVSGPPLYWSTLSELDQDAAYLARVDEEFFPDAKPERFFEADGDEDKLTSPLSRRTFLKFSAFSALVAAVSGCERPVQKILPYVNKPEEINFGQANYYASTCRECPSACGLLVKTREGRPVKLDGNPDHPMNRGSLCTRGQSSILNLYNPDRLKHPVRVGRKANRIEAASNGFTRMAEFDAEIGAALKAAKGKVVLLTPTITGPSNDRLIADLLTGGGLNFEHVIYDALESGEERQAYAAAFGREVSPRYSWEKADAVLCLGGDPLGQSSSQTATQRGWAAKRLPTAEGGMSRTYTFEPAPTITGINSDYRYPTRPADLLGVGLAIAALVHQELSAGEKPNAVVKSKEVAALLGGVSVSSLASAAGIAESELQRVAKSLVAAAGHGLVYTNGGAAGTTESASLHLLGILLNAMLGNYGTTIDTEVSPSKQSLGSVAAVLRLLGEMNAGKVEVLIIHGVNPVYTLPKGAGFAEALAKVKLVVSLNLMLDETTALADIAVPAVHGLESWGDAEPQAGLFSTQQPVINPIFGKDSADPLFATRPWQESLIAFAAAAGSRVFQRTPTKADVQQFLADAGTTDTLKLNPKQLEPYTITWYQYIRETWREKIYEKGAFAAETFDAFWNSLIQAGILDTIGDARDGRAPSPAFAASAVEGIKLREKADGLVLVAQPSNFHGDGESMTNPFLLELSDPVSKVCWDNYASISPARAKELGVEDGDHVKVTVGDASVEIPAYIQPGVHKDVVAIGLGWGRRNFGAVGEGIGVDVYPLLATKSAGGTSTSATTGAWSIDLNACTGCSSCVVACQAENNIPVVGKEDVLRGREMHWLRIDRYEVDRGGELVVNQPMMCVHCENAPCEYVCPVEATSHSAEGLNEMTYNRCVGTRYCQNNCPYKVRRFNFFQYTRLPHRAPRRQSSASGPARAGAQPRRHRPPRAA